MTIFVSVFLDSDWLCIVPTGGGPHDGHPGGEGEADAAMLPGQV